jgi:SAM-dependent methyltransferase
MWGWSFEAFLWVEMPEGVSFCKLDTNQDQLRRNIDVFRAGHFTSTPIRLRHSFGKFAYTVSSDGAAKLLNNCLPLRDQLIPFPGFDVVIENTSIDFMMNAVYPGIRAYVSIPPLAICENRHETSHSRPHAQEDDPETGRRDSEIRYATPQTENNPTAEEREKYMNDICANRAAIQRLVIDSNDCITDMCLIGKKYPSDKSPLSPVGTLPGPGVGYYRHAYTPIYSLLFTQMKNRPIDLAEIGIGHGGGLRIFREFFPEARLFGFEFDRRWIDLVTGLGMEKTRIAFINVAEEDCITRAFEESGTRFDLIIDDASHIASHQINVIRRCAPFLKPGGMLIIEDIYNDSRAPESLFEGVIREMHEQFSLATFIHPKDRRVKVDDLNNEKLLLLVKR